MRGAGTLRGLVATLPWILPQVGQAETDVAKDLYAAQIDESNAAGLRVGGPDAIGGLGDWAIGNGTLCAVVSDPSHESVLSELGGILIDLAHCDRNDDQWGALQSLINMSRDSVVPVASVRAELDRADGEARIITRGEVGGISVETTYSLRRDRPHALGIDTRLRREREGERFFLFGDVSLHGHRQLSGFALASERLQQSKGFSHAPLDPFQPLEMLDAVVPADTQVLVGGDALSPGISYGLQIVETRLEGVDGEARPVATLTVNGTDFSMLGVFVRPFWLGGRDSLGLVPLAQTLLMDLYPGESLLIRRLMHVGERADVASVTDRIWPTGTRVHGSLPDPSARLHVWLVEPSAPVTEVRPDEDGSFSFRVPPGRYGVKVVAPGQRSLRREVEVKGQDLELEPFDLPPAAKLVLQATPPVRLVFVGSEDTPDPAFGADLLGFRIGGEPIAASTEANQVSLAGIASDPTELQLAPGRYDVYATRGIEYEVTESKLTLAAGQTRTLEIESPQRALRSPRWISADLHVHSEWSDDSALPQDMRIASFVAQHGEVMVATEHDNVIDYAPRIRELGLSGEIVSVVGVEVTGTAHSPAAPRTIGHLNTFPLPYRPLLYRGGAPRGEGRRLRDMLREVRSLGGERIVQLNHPRKAREDDSDGSFFTHLSQGTPFDPKLALTAPTNRSLLEEASEDGLRDLDFDALEVMNGGSMKRYRKIRADWFSLLLQGEFKTGTANSDSHSSGEIVALPVNYVRVDNDSVPAFKQDAFVSALRQGRSYGTTGPILDMELVGEGKAGIGETYYGDFASLHLRVRAASWVPVSEARVYVNGELIYRGALEAGESQELPLKFEADAFVTAEVEGEPGDVYRAVAPGFVPFAFSNPIFVDANEDLEWTAPGLPTVLPDTIATPVPPASSDSGAQ